MATDRGPYERPRRPASRRPEGTAIVGKVAAGVPTGRAPRTSNTVSVRQRMYRPTPQRGVVLKHGEGRDCSLGAARFER